MTKIILLFISVFISVIQNASAQDYANPVERGEVLVERPSNFSLPYKQRRSKYGVLFSANMENFKPEEYDSFIQNVNYEKLTEGKAMSLVNLEFGFKYNVAMGSASILAGYSTGKMSNDTTKLEELSINITKIDLNLALDGIMDEPYVAPYVQAGFNQMDWTERSAVGNTVKEENFTADWNYHYKAGVSFQLNWIERSIDPSSPEQALRSSGLENTYLDIFYMVYNEPPIVATIDNGGEGEANLQSSQYGVGLKLEF
jgi:hypothetical protein